MDLVSADRMAVEHMATSGVRSESQQKRCDVVRQPSATVQRSELQAMVEREWRMHTEAHQRLNERPALVNPIDYANLLATD